MRVALVHSFYSDLVPSGENTVVRDQAAALASAGNTVELFARQSTDATEQLTQKVRAAVRVATGLGEGPGEGLERFRPDIVHVHNLHPNWGARWVGRYADRTVATLHNYRPVCAAATLFRDGHDCVECLDRGSSRSLVHRCYRGSVVTTLPLAISSRRHGTRHPLMSRLSTAITLNPQAQEFWPQHFPDVTFHLVPNFVPANDPPAATEREFWLYAGRLTEDKGIGWLLENWPEGENLVIAGAGPMQDLVEREAGRRADITYSGRVERAELLTLLTRARALLVPSLWSEGLPTVALEAIAAGTPVLASSSASGLAEIVTGGAGLWIRTGAGRAELEARLAELTADHAGFLLRARQVHARHYSPATWLERIHSVYERMTANRIDGGKAT